jgi:hypothetical protein
MTEFEIDKTAATLPDGPGNPIGSETATTRPKAADSPQEPVYAWLEAELDVRSNKRRRGFQRSYIPAAPLPEQSTRGGYRGPLLFLAGLSLLFRLPVLFWNDSLRLDEGFSLRFIEPDPWEIVQHGANDSHTPFYTLLLKGWCQVFGTGEIAIRSLSLLLGLLAVFCLYELGRQVYGPKAALWAGILGATSPLWVWFSAEARMYTLWLAVACIHSIFFFHLARRPGLFYVLAYGLSGAVLVYTQYIGILLTATHLGYLLLTWKYNRRLLWWLGQSYCLMLAALIPWGVALLAFYTGYESDVLPAPSFGEVFNLIIQLLAGYNTDNAWFVAAAPFLKAGLVSLFLLFLMIFLPVFLTGKQIAAHTKLFVLAPPVWIVAFFFFSFITSIMEARYLLFMTPLFYLALGRWLSRLGGKKGQALAALILVAVCAGAVYLQTTDPASSERVNYRGAASYLSAKIRPGDRIVLDAYFIEPAFTYYYRPSLVAPIIYGPTSTEVAAEGPDLMKQRLSAPPGTHLIWLVQSYWERPISPSAQYLFNHYTMVEGQVFSPELRVLAFWVAN